MTLKHNVANAIAEWKIINNYLKPNNSHLYASIMNIHVNQINTYKRCCCKDKDYKDIWRLKRAIITTARMEHSLLPELKQRQTCH